MVNGLKLKAVREREGMSQQELAARLDVSYSTISKIEKNKRKCSRKLFDGLVRVLGVTGKDLGADITSEKRRSSIC